jgi:hypothetical protein
MKKSLLITFLFIVAACSASQQEITTQKAEDITFNRETALKKYKDSCKLQLVLAMGLSAQKQSGLSRTELEEIALNSKNPELMITMVIELYGTPELQGRTYTFFKFENCLISKSTGKPPLSLEKVRKELKECESKNSDLISLIQCIDSIIFNSIKES